MGEVVPLDISARLRKLEQSVVMLAEADAQKTRVIFDQANAITQLEAQVADLQEAADRQKKDRFNV